MAPTRNWDFIKLILDLLRDCSTERTDNMSTTCTIQIDGTGSLEDTSVMCHDARDRRWGCEGIRGEGVGRGTADAIGD
jgi:hypothetical protein